MTDFLLDYSIIKAGRKPMAVFRMRGTTFVSTNGRYELVETQYGAWRAHCRCCQWDDWGKGPSHADAMDTAYAHIASCPRAQKAAVADNLIRAEVA